MTQNRNTQNRNPQNRNPQALKPWIADPQLAEPVQSRSIWQSIIQFFRQWDSAEPQIREIVGPSGKLNWRIYDPISDRVLTMTSEQEVLRWLEERHSAWSHPDFLG